MLPPWLLLRSHRGNVCLPLLLCAALRCAALQLVLQVLEASCPDALKGLSHLPLEPAMNQIVNGVKKHLH